MQSNREGGVQVEWQGVYKSASHGTRCVYSSHYHCVRLAALVWVQDYKLAVNNGVNALHGGLVGFDKRVWAAETYSSDDRAGVKFTLTAADMEEGYPAELEVRTGQQTLRSWRAHPALHACRSRQTTASATTMISP